MFSKACQCALNEQPPKCSGCRCDQCVCRPCLNVAERRDSCLQEAGMMAAMRHPNVVLYLGVCLDPPCVVTEYCARGSLNDVLKRALYNPKYAEQLDWRVRYPP